ncbi:MAG: hypothetical protein ACE5IZ_07870 [Dehalococcoidia bacterium]
MTRKLFLAYLAITLGPLALAMAAWVVRDALRRLPAAKGWRPGGRRDGSEETLERTVEEVRASEG